MSVNTQQIRNWYEPACVGPWARVSLHGAGKVSVRPTIVPAVKALDACLIRHDYRTRAADTGAYNCRIITGGTKKSLHAYGIALDLNWQTNPYGPRLITDMPRAMIVQIKAIRTNNGKQVWRWGGDYSGNKDAMHFEVICSPADLATGINPRTVPGWDEDPVWSFPKFPGPMSEGEVSDDVAALKFILVANGFGHFNREPKWARHYTAGVSNEVRRLCEFHDFLCRSAGKPQDQWNSNGKAVGPKIWSFLGWLTAVNRKG